MLRIPVGATESFAANYSVLPDEAKKTQILHTVRKKETLATIARKYGISRKLLAEANSLKATKSLAVGSTLVVPVSSTLNYASLDDNDHVSKSKKHKKGLGISSAAATGSASVVVVKKGDSLGKIASRAGVSVAALKRQNGLTSSALLVGQRLEIPRNVAKPESTKTLAVARRDSSKTGSAQSYTVKKGDTLAAIASIFGVSVGDLKVWNRIHGHKLKIGQELKINS
jgi:LysM repeat protein